MIGRTSARRRVTRPLLTHLLVDTGVLDENTSHHMARMRRRIAALLGVNASEVPTVLTMEWEARIRAVLPQLAAQRQANVAQWRRGQGRLGGGSLAELERAKVTARAEIAAQLRAMFDSQVRQAVSERIAERTAHLDARESELDDLEVRRRARLASVVELLSYDEFRRVLSCLHPDRAPPDRQEKFAEAFAIFQRFEAAANPALSIADLRARGWDHIAPYRRP